MRKYARVSELVTTEEIKKWNKGDIITIKAGTGKGKSYFIKNILYAFARKEKKKILMLIHRVNCINQFEEEINADKKTDTIKIMSYQAIESIYKNNGQFDFSEYEYIVCDEFHYFLGDAGFNKTTDISLNTILEQTDKIRVFMSATGDDMQSYINHRKKLNSINYEMDIDYDFIESLTFFNQDETMEKFMEECIAGNEKAIFFIQSATKAHKLYEKFRDHSLFNVSRSDKHYKYVDEEKIQKMLKEEHFNEKVLITTTALDAGVNIIDLDLKHIIVDVEDVGSLIQCIGRKRIQSEDDKIHVYIHNITNKQLGNRITNIRTKIKKADFLREHTVQEYVEKYGRDIDYFSIVYDDITIYEDKSTKKLNELAYYKAVKDIGNYQLMIKYGKTGYRDFILKLLGRKSYITLEEEYEKETLEQYFESRLGEVMLTHRDRKELIEKMNVTQNGKLLKSLDSLNSALREQNICYFIDRFSTSRIVNGKKKNYKSAWRVLKLVEE